jgi:hypothetical protein
MDSDLLDLSLSLGELATPVVVLGISFVVFMVIKDTLMEIAYGLQFRFNPNFKDGDIVFLDGERAIIVKRGILTTVFGVNKPDGTYSWRYVANSRIESLKLEKIINIREMKIPGREE